MGWPQSCGGVLRLLCFALLLPLQAIAQERTALVIGNAAYVGDPLENPGNDADDMAAMLRRLGFDVTLRRDATLRVMREAIEAWTLRLRKGGVGLFYFAGHGVQVEGENYLIPLRANISREQDVPYEAVPLGRVLGGLEDARNPLNIIILDACRNNPYARGWRAPQRGLAVVHAASGTLIAFATSPGAVAIDGSGRNGVYTAQLLAHLPTPGLSIEQLFKKVRAGVIETTRGQQIPWETSSLTGEFFFTPPLLGASPAPASTPVPPVPPGLDPEAVTWSLVAQSPAPEDVEAFLKAYPQGRFASAARIRLHQLQRLTAQVPSPADRLPPAPTRPQENPRQMPESPPRQEASLPATPVGRPDPASALRAEAIGRFFKYENGTALDTATNLLWMTRDFRNLEKREPQHWHEAMQWVEKMNRQRYGGYSDWRVPTVEEYAAIYDSQKPRRDYRGKPVGYPQAFEDGGGLWFCSNETTASSSGTSERGNGFSFLDGDRSSRVIKFHAIVPLERWDSIRLVRQGP